MSNLLKLPWVLFCLMMVTLGVSGQDKKPLLEKKLLLSSAWYSGNIERFDFRVAGDISHQDSAYELSVAAAFLYSETDLQVKNREYNGSVKYDYLPLQRFSPFLMATVYSNQFKGIGLRLSALAGAKYRYYYTETSDFSISAALQEDFEHYAFPGGSEDPLKLDRHRMRLSVRPKFKQKIGALLSFEHVTFYQPSVTALNDYRILSRTSLNTRITPSVQVGISYEYDMQSKPPDASIRKEDHLVMANLTLKF